MAHSFFSIHSHQPCHRHQISLSPLVSPLQENANFNSTTRPHNLSVPHPCWTESRPSDSVTINTSPWRPNRSRIPWFSTGPNLPPFWTRSSPLAWVPINTNRQRRWRTNHSAQLDRAQSFSLLDQVRSFDLGLYKIEAQESPDPDDPIQNQLTRAPSFLERIMSWKLIGRSESIKAEENKPGTEPKPKPKSETETMGGGEDLVEGRGEEEGVDAKADDFIKRFKQQLRLERLDSILRYRDMLQRRH